MAKMTVQDVTYEGTPQELREIIATFEAVDSKPAEVKPQYKTEKRHATVGERILVTNAICATSYKNGDVFTAERILGNSGLFVDEHSVGLYHREYEVIVEPTKAKLPADLITHKDVHYSLVQRKAQPGDVVVFTENTSRSVDNGKAYEVSEDIGIAITTHYTPSVYRDHYNRTEANVLVYEKVAAVEPLKVGDIVEVTDGSESRYNDLKTGAVGKITKINNDDNFRNEPIEVTTDDDYDRFPASALRKVENPDIFTKLGRKINEFKKGDIFGYRDARHDGRIIPHAVSEIRGSAIIFYDENYSSTNSIFSGSDRLTLIAPVESRVDTK